METITYTDAPAAVASIPKTQFDATVCADMDCHVDVSRVAATEAALAMTRVFR